MSFARTWAFKATLAPIRRLAGSAVWRLTFAFAAPLALAFGVFFVASYWVIVTEDTKADKQAIGAEAYSLTHDIHDWQALSAWMNYRLAASNIGIYTRLYDVPDPDAPKAIRVLTQDAGYGEPRPVECPRFWMHIGHCVGPTGVAWYFVVDPAGREMGLAQLVDVSALSGKHIKTYVLVGHLSAMRDVEARIIGLGEIMILLAVVAATAVGFLVGRRILQRVDALNAVLQSIDRGQFDARASDASADDEFGVLARSVNAMLDRIQRLVLHAQAISDAVAHDLRRPLSRLRSNLVQLSKAPSLAEAMAGTDAAIDETDELLAKFQALLSRGELRSGADSGLALLDLAECARGATNVWLQNAEEKGIRVVVDAEPAPMLGNRHWLDGLVSNLVDNAIKYAPPDTELRVTVRRLGDIVRLRVTDQGLGIPKAERESVLKMFARGTSTGGAPGSGVGLAMVDEIVRRHAGRLRIEDAEPTGADITCEFRAFD